MNEGSQSADQVQHGEPIQHTRFHTGLSCDALVHAFERELGRLDPALPTTLVERKAAWDEVRVALYDDGDPRGAVIAYDRPSSFLATLGHPELAAIGESLDRKIDAVTAAVRSGR